MNTNKTLKPPQVGQSALTDGLDERCDSCKFWKHLDEFGQDNHPDDKPGQCRRYPPRLDLSEADSWQEDKYGYSYLDYRFWNHPVTEAADWCGEFKPSNGSVQPTAKAGR